MAEEMDMMGEQPPMASQIDMKNAQDNLMSSDPEIQTVLMSRITQMTPEELQALDEAVTPVVQTALLKLLPELGELIDMLNEQGVEETMPEETPTEENIVDESGMPRDMGALGNM